MKKMFKPCEKISPNFKRVKLLLYAGFSCTLVANAAELSDYTWPENSLISKFIYEATENTVIFWKTLQQIEGLLQPHQVLHLQIFGKMVVI